APTTNPVETPPPPGARSLDPPPQPLGEVRPRPEVTPGDVVPPPNDAVRDHLGSNLDGLPCRFDGVLPQPGRSRTDSAKHRLNNVPERLRVAVREHDRRNQSADGHNDDADRVRRQRRVE